MMLHLNGHIAWRGTVFRARVCIAATGRVNTDIVRLCACAVIIYTCIQIIGLTLTFSPGL